MRAIVCCVALLAGCADAHPTYAPDGRRAAVVKCGGWARDWGMCYQKAGELCGARGYDVLNKSGESFMDRDLLIACKP
jgi:hypothetical protein